MRRLIVGALASLVIAGCVEPVPSPAGDGGTPTAETPSDAAVVAANTHLARGRPWYAYQALRPALADSTRRTPSVDFLAGTAARRWGGWREGERRRVGAGGSGAVVDG